jgi:predicted CXXCH cytochrome family protein
VQAEGCSGCHTSHFAPVRGLIRGAEKDVCLTCHGQDKLGEPPLRNIAKEMEKKKLLHGPIQKGRCTPCHEPHGSANYRLLKGNYPQPLYIPYREDSYTFCLGCHDKNLLKFADTTVYTKFRNGKRNLHYVHVANKTKGRTCRLCHDVHASDGEKLISPAGAPFGAWRVPLRFAITSTGGSCAPGCHKPYAYDREKPVVYRGEDSQEEGPAEK